MEVIDPWAGHELDYVPSEPVSSKSAALKVVEGKGSQDAFSKGPSSKEEEEKLIYREWVLSGKQGGEKVLKRVTNKRVLSPGEIGDRVQRRRERKEERERRRKEMVLNGEELDDDDEDEEEEEEEFEEEVPTSPLLNNKIFES